MPNVAAALVGIAGLIIAEGGSQSMPIEAHRAEASRLLTAGIVLNTSIGRETTLAERRHASQWLADIAPAEVTPTVAHALRMARAVAATAPFDMSPVSASG